MDAIKILGSLLNSGAVSSGTANDVLNQVLRMATGGSQSGGSGSNSGLGSLLGGLLGGGTQQSGSSGGLGDLLGGLMGGGRGGSSGGDLGSLITSMMGGGQNGTSLGNILGAALNQFNRTQGQGPTASTSLPPDISNEQANEQAKLMVRAMVNAAKSDGRVDASEQEKIVGRLGDVSQEELEWINTELTTPLDADHFARTIPKGMEMQVYTMSLMAIDLDSDAEARYLDQLAKATGIPPDACNEIHQKFGVVALYR